VKPLPASIFELPKGYKMEDFGQMMQEIQRMSENTD